MPVPHGRHADALDRLWNRPRSQRWHAVLWVTFWNVPALHATQLLPRVLFWKVPIPQMTHVDVLFWL